VGTYINSTEIQMLTYCRGTMKIIEESGEKGRFTCTWDNETKIDQEIGYKG